MTFSGISLPRLKLRPALLGWVFVLSWVGALFAKEDPVGLLQRHRYEEAISVWDQELQASRIGEASLKALKGQAIAAFRLGSLYGTLQDFSLAIMDDYYGQLAETSPTPWAILYLGEIQLALGQTAKAKSWLEKVATSSNMPVQEMAAVTLQFLGGPAFTPKGLDAQWQALTLKKVSSSATGSLTTNTPRSRRCKLSSLTMDLIPNRIALEKALAAVVKDAQEPEVVQDLGKNTQINFYDPRLMETLSRGYFTLAKALNLEILSQENKSPELAAKFHTSLALAETALRLDQLEIASQYLGQDASTDAQLLRARLFAKSKRTKEALDLLENLLAKAGRNAIFKRDIAEVYYLCNLSPDRGLQIIGQALKDKNGPAYYRVEAGLLLAKGQSDAALQQYAKGYKIEFRNRIDQIDPEYMSDYSFAIYQNNKLRYEEIVETLYHLQKEFPASRQMHYCMQGVSAGLARSFEAQRIFRKGG
jgi:tetratricopeptide (TPR) repeat protein